MRECSLVTQFHWIENGAGEPVVLLHGLLSTVEHWESTLATLAGRWRGLALSLPIFDLPAGDLSVRSLGTHVVDFLEAERIPPAVLVGNSLGGHVALDVALRAPHRVRGLVLSGSSGLFERRVSRGVPHRPSAAFVRERMEEVFHDPALVTPAWVEAVWQVVSRRSSALRVVQISRAARRDSVEGRLAGVACPTLLVWGREDRITPPEVGLRFLHGIRRSEIRFIPRCGHAPMLEQPEAFNEIVAAFLDGLAAREPLAAGA
jgi:pimeloyl-ACP methyl ester carboxylesterase